MAIVKAQLIYCSDTGVNIGVIGKLRTPSQRNLSFSFESSRLNIYEPSVTNYGEDFIYDFNETIFEIEAVNVFNEETIYKFLLIG